MSEENRSTEFAAVLGELKQRSGLSFERLGSRCGVSTSTLHRYCRGQALPSSFGVVERIARACGAGRPDLLRLHRAWMLAQFAREECQLPAPRPTTGAVDTAVVAGSVAVPDPEVPVVAVPEPAVPEPAVPEPAVPEPAVSDVAVPVVVGPVDRDAEVVAVPGPARRGRLVVLTVLITAAISTALTALVMRGVVAEVAERSTGQTWRPDQYSAALPVGPTVPLGGWCAGAVDPPNENRRTGTVSYQGEQHCYQFGGRHELSIVLQVFMPDAHGGHWADVTTAAGRPVPATSGAVSGSRTAAPYAFVLCRDVGSGLMRTHATGTVDLEGGGTIGRELTSWAVQVRCDRR